MLGLYPGRELRAEARLPGLGQRGLDPARLVPVLHYDGTPITARFIIADIAERLAPPVVERLREAV